MAIDTPATIAILGAGPIGLEAALYARYLGYDVQIFERAQVAAGVLRSAHVRSFAPFGLNRSALGLAALSAQHPNWQRPADDEHLTGAEFAERYLIPLSQTDLLIDGLHERTEVIAIGRDGPYRQELSGDESRGDWMFRVLTRTAGGREDVTLADLVIDATGLTQHRWMGQGGIPARGELDLQNSIAYEVPDVLGSLRQQYAGLHTVVVGSGHSAATSVVQLARLADEVPETRVTWISRRQSDEDALETLLPPVERIEDDPLPERDSTAMQANELALSGDKELEYVPATMIDSIQRTGTGRLQLDILGARTAPIECDNLVANVGRRGDYRFLAELQVALPWSPAGADDQRPERLLLPEPNFYILGSKSHFRRNHFLVADGLSQIRDLFSIIGDRKNLDLYATMTGLLPK